MSIKISSASCRVFQQCMKTHISRLKTLAEASKSFLAFFISIKPFNEKGVKKIRDLIIIGYFHEINFNKITFLGRIGHFFKEKKTLSIINNNLSQKKIENVQAAKSPNYSD